MFAGTITIGAGEDRVVIRPAGLLRGALIDLKGIHLVVPGGVPVGSTIEGTNADPGHAGELPRSYLIQKKKKSANSALLRETCRWRPP